MRDYGKVPSALWTDPRFVGLPDDAKLLHLYLLTGPHGTIAGVFRLTDGYVSDDLVWPVERVAEPFRELFSKGFANRCETTKWVWIREHFAANPLENPNQRKAAAKCASGVPAECSWRPEFMRVCGPLIGLNADPAPQPSPNSSPTVSEPVAIAIAIEEKDSGLPPCPHKELIALFARSVPQLPRPKVELWKGTRQTTMQARWKWVLTETRENGERYATNKAQALEWFGKFFDHVARSDFLTGRNGKWGGCTLQWLMKAENFSKVVEGNYATERVQ